MSNFSNEHVRASTHFGGKGVDVTLKGKHETVSVSVSLNEHGEPVVHKHTHRHAAK